MSDRDKAKNARENDARQSGEGNSALGGDARSFGEGGQVEQRAFDPGHKDARDRDPDRDPTVPELDQAGQDR